MFSTKPTTIPTPEQALAGRAHPIPTASHHFVNANPLKGPYPDGNQSAIFGMGCFWGVERIFWQLEGIWVSSVGYSAGHTPNPTYEEVCTGKTGHNEVVFINFDPNQISYDALLRVFWENHDPTQGMRQGNDRGTQYRSGIYYFGDAQAQAAQASKAMVQPLLSQRGYGAITTEITPAGIFYFAEDYHQQYLAKNPDGYCGMGGTGISCPIRTQA